MVEIVLKTDFRVAFDKLAKLPAQVERKAIPAALNRAAAKAKTDMTKRIAATYEIKRSEIASGIRIVRSRGRYPIVIIDPFGSNRKGRAKNVIHFLERSVTLAEGRRRKKRGTQNALRFKIKKGSAPKLITGAFIGNKGRTVFRRIGRRRLPIEGVVTIGLPSMFNTRRINQAVVAGIRQDLPIQIDRAIAAALGGYLGQGR